MQFSPYQPPVNDGLDIIYQDDALLVVNKPCGLLTTPGRGEDKQDCLISRVRQEYDAAADIIHRLDMATSGLVCIALTRDMQREMSILFQQRQIHKTYIAVVDGIVSHQHGCIDLPMITDWPNRPLQMIDFVNGKAAITYYKVLDTDVSLNRTRVELRPVTGRTHQLRLHMQAIGHTIIGDNLYSRSIPSTTESRLLLHATSLEFIHPGTGQLIHLSKLPAFQLSTDK